MATYSARVPSRYQSARPNTRCPTDSPVVPYPRAVTTPASSWPGIDGVRSRSRRSVQVEGHASSVPTVYRCVRLGPLCQLHPDRSRRLIRYYDCLHGNCLLDHLCVWCKCCIDGRVSLTDERG